MNDSSGFNFPTGPRAPGQTQPSAQPERPYVKITEISGDLRDIRQTTRIRGEVVRQTRDTGTQETTVRIRTPRGEVEIRLPREQTPPREGQQVNVEIPPGRPPQRASVTPVEERNPERRPPQLYTRETAPPPRTSETPVNVELRPAPEITTASQTEAPRQNVSTRPAPESIQDLPRTLPPPETTVRIQPVAIRELTALLAQQPAPDIITAVVEPVIQTRVLQTQIIAQQVQQTPLEQIQNFISQTPVTKPETIQTTTVAATPPPLSVTAAALPDAPLLALNPDVVLNAAATNFTPPPLQAIRLAGAPPTQNMQPSIAAFTLTTPPLLSENTLNEFAPAILTPPNTGSAAIAETFAPTPVGIPLKQPLNINITGVQPPDVALVIPGTEKISLNETIKALQSPGAPTEHKPQHHITNNTAPAALNAVVLGQTPGSLPIIAITFPESATVQGFILQSPVQDITPGTQIQITPQASLNAPLHTAPPIAGIAPPLGALFTPGAWPVLDDLYHTLTQIAPQAAQAFSNIVPSAAGSPAQITPAALFFISALRGGDLSQWLGDKATELLRTSARGNNALSRLGQESGMLSRAGGETISQDWRAVPIPMFYEGELHKIALYYKQNQQENQNDQQQGKQTRFIFDLALDQMGAVQVDGLFRPGRLDVVIRTEEHLSQAMQMDMRQTYTKALRQTEVTGELTFQNQNEGWVTIQADKKDGFGVSA